VTQLVKTRHERGLLLPDILGLLVYLFSLAGTDVLFPAVEQSHLLGALKQALYEDREKLQGNLSKLGKSYQGSKDIQVFEVKNKYLVNTFILNFVFCWRLSCCIRFSIKRIIVIIQNVELLLNALRFNVLSFSASSLIQLKYPMKARCMSLIKSVYCYSITCIIS
jgi:hypothetical protein